MSKRYEERRKYRIGDFEYLLDDDDRTAWIYEGNSGGAKVYTMPDKVEIDGVIYTITSVEIGAYQTPLDINLEEVIFPDCYENFDEYTFCNSPIKKVYLGKGFQYYMYWTLKSAADDFIVEIDPDNPYLKMSDDGHMVLTKDGKELIYLIHDLDEVVVPEGVESIVGCAISCKDKLRRITFPSSLKKIAGDGIIQIRFLEKLVVPEGVTDIGLQAFCGDWSLKLLDLPSTVREVQYEFIMEDMCLEKIILRSPDVVRVDIYGDYWNERIPLETCHLVVPRQLIPSYRSHPYWGWFKHIDILND